MPGLHVVQQAHARENVDEAGVLVIGQRRLRGGSDSRNQVHTVTLMTLYVTVIRG
jgi:hypothetical protein